MKVDTSSPFVRYELSEEELISAHILTDLQVAGMKNLLSDAVEDLISIPLELDDESPEGKNKRAYTQGMVAAYKYILDVHAANLDTLQKIQSQQADQGE